MIGQFIPDVFILVGMVTMDEYFGANNDWSKYEGIIGGGTYYILALLHEMN
jgi:hypothetical protein